MKISANLSYTATAVTDNDNEDAPVVASLGAGQCGGDEASGNKGRGVSDLHLEKGRDALDSCDNHSNVICCCCCSRRMKREKGGGEERSRRRGESGSRLRVEVDGMCGGKRKEELVQVLSSRLQVQVLGKAEKVSAVLQRSGGVRVGTGVQVRAVEKTGRPAVWCWRWRWSLAWRHWEGAAASLRHCR